MGEANDGRMEAGVIGDECSIAVLSSGKTSAPSALTMRLVKKPVTDPPPPILEGYMLIRNAHGGYYLISTGDSSVTVSSSVQKQALPPEVPSSAVGQEATSPAVPLTSPQHQRPREKEVIKAKPSHTSVRSSTSTIHRRSEDVVPWITNAILSFAERRATKAEIFDWIEKNAAQPPKSNWRTQVHRTLNSRRNIYQKFVKHNSDGTPEVYYTLVHVVLRPAVVNSLTKANLLQPKPGGRYRAILPKGGHSSIEHSSANSRWTAPNVASIGKNSAASVQNGVVVGASVEGNESQNAGSTTRGYTVLSAAAKTAAKEKDTRTEKDFYTTSSGPGAAAFVMMTGLDPLVFDILLKDLEGKATTVRNLRQTLGPRDALSLILLWLRHDPTPEQLRRWFIGEDVSEGNARLGRHQRDQHWRQIRRLRQRWLPFLASWLKDLIVWSDLRSERLPPLIRDWLASAECGQHPARVVGFLDPLIIPVKREKLDECCECVAVFIIVYNFDGAIIFRSPAIWAPCPRELRTSFEGSVRSAISTCYQRDLSRLLEPSQTLLVYSKDVKDGKGLPAPIRVVRSSMVANFLRDKFQDRLKRQFRILTAPMSPDGTSLRLLCQNHLVTVCAALANLTPPILWEEGSNAEVGASSQEYAA